MLNTLDGLHRRHDVVGDVTELMGFHADKVVEKRTLNINKTECMRKQFLNALYI